MSRRAVQPGGRWHAAGRRWHEAGRRWRHSLRWRLVTLFVVLALATTAVFVGGVRRIVAAGWEGYARPLLADYADRLAAEIGSPPDPARARAIAERLPVAVHIEGPSVALDAGRGALTGSRGVGGEAFTITRQTADGHHITFALAEPQPGERSRRFGGWTLAALLGLTLLAFAVVRRLLAPLEEIGRGVERFGAGDFGAPIHVRRHDELGDLALRINGMAKSLQAMLDAKRALLLAISHELRSPLTRARVNAELVEEGEARTALLADLAEMRDLIGDLLESERLAAGHAALHAETLDAAALVREVVAERFAATPPELDLPDEPCTARVDRARFALLVRNLLDNAQRHGAAADGRPPKLTLRVEGGDLRLVVRDHGRGIGEEALARLGEAFYRPDASRGRATGGVGLGLALCRLVAQAHGGTLSFRRAAPGLEAVVRWPAGGPAR